MILDAHQHFWQYDPVEYDWIAPDEGALQRDYLPQDLQPVLSKHGVAGCLAVQASQHLAESDRLLDYAERYDFIRGVVGWVDLRSPRVQDDLNRLAPHPAFAGVRHILQAEPTGYMLQKDFQRGLSHLAGAGLTYDLLLHAGQIREATRLVAAFPDQVFILDHLGKPAYADGLTDNYRRDLGELAEHPNVCCKLSGLVTEMDGRPWKTTTFTPFIDFALEVFGPDRLLFGSDWPVCRLAANYGEVKSLLEQSIAQLSAPERAGIMGLNAVRIYQLPPKLTN